MLFFIIPKFNRVNLSYIFLNYSKKLLTNSKNCIFALASPTQLAPD